MEKSDIQREVELTLSSLDNLGKVSAPDGFLESVTGKIIFQKDQVIWMQRAKYAVAAMIAFAVINVVLLISTNSNNRTEMLQSVASEWNQTNEPF